MPVLVTGGETPAGRTTARELLRAGGEVRLWVGEDVDPGVVAGLRSHGYKLARGDMDDEGRLELALEQVHTVVHLSGDLLTPPGALLDDVASVASAAVGAGCRRLVWRSHRWAVQPDGNPWLEACAEAEELLADAPLETVIVRTGVCYGPGDPLTRALRAAPPDSPARHAPLYLDDLGEAVAVIDRERSGLADLHIVVDMAGPEEVTWPEFARALGSLPPGPGIASLPEHTRELLARDTPAPPAALGTTGTPIAAVAQLIREAG